jgi:pyruvate dehydrogenase E1 component
MVTHQQKKMGDLESLREFRDRFDLPIKDSELESLPYLKFARDSSKEVAYLRERRMALGGYLPQRRSQGRAARSAPLSAFDALLKASGEGRELSTTMAFVRIIEHPAARPAHRSSAWCPSCPTNRAPSAWKACSARSASGFQVGPALRAAGRRPADVLQGIEGPDPAGRHQRGRCAMSDWIAAATAYSVHGVATIPFYIFYSMFGFQRVGDLDLGRRRPALARLPARRHLRPHHAEWRRPAA